MSWMKVKKIDDRAIIPHRAHDSDAGLDVYTIENGCIHAGKDGIIRTGISMAIPNDRVAIVMNKSGRATKDKLDVGSCVIDSGYRGELLIHMFNNSDLPFTYGPEEKIAQLIILPCWSGQPEEVEILDDTERGDGGFGSTGIRMTETCMEDIEGDCKYTGKPLSECNCGDCDYPWVIKKLDPLVGFDYNKACKDMMGE